MPDSYPRTLGIWCGLLIALIAYFPRIAPQPQPTQSALKQTQPAHLPVKGKGHK